MNIFEHRSELAVTADKLYRYHCSPGAFQRLTPPWETVKVSEPDQGIKEGDVRHLRIGPGPGVGWQAVHEDFVQDRQFVDRQGRGPLKSWRHLHSFEPQDQGSSLLRDYIEYRFPFDLPLGFLLEGLLERTFRYRHRQTRRDLKKISAYPGPMSDEGEPLRIGITGSSGFVGRALSSFLGVAGHHVVKLKRGYGRLAGDEALWWPEPDLKALEGLDAVVHLAGEPVAQPWTSSVRERIYFSRTEGTKRLCRALAELENPPSVLVSASATGYYDQTLDHPVDENASCGDNFLSTVCRDWEASTFPAEKAGIRVCHLRVGLVVSSGGGFLTPQFPAFKTGLGPILGDGTQMQPIIDLDDTVGAIYHLISKSDLSGPFNGTAPHPLPQSDFAKQLARACSAPQWLKLPEALARRVLGEQAGLLFEGVAALPKRLLESGYEFHSPTFWDSLKHQMSLPEEGSLN
jgi:uncharacterized protein (TIGR01777 family)